MTTDPPTTETLDQALSRVWEHDWRHRRSGPTLRSQAEIAVKELQSSATLATVFPIIGQPRNSLRVSDIGKRDVQAATSYWYTEGLSPATIQKRLNCLSKLGVNVEGCRVKVPKGLKWYLPEDKRDAVIDWCDENDYGQLGQLIDWTTRTGLRIEESLRLEPFHFHTEGVPSVADGFRVTAVSVPGTKTSTSQAVLPLGTVAAHVVWGWLMTVPYGSARKKFFTNTYEEFQTQWNHVREHFGWSSDPTATLKALRRSAARYLHIDCGMPLHMVQQYLRHESMDTTLEYLRLTGGYGTEEMRRYLK